MGQSDDALLAYSRASRFNPALEASWRGQFQILTDQGMERQAIQTLGQLERLQALPPPLVAVMDLIAQGRLLKAEELCRQYLVKVPHQVEGMRLLADIGMRLGVLNDAEFLLESALVFEPDNVRIRIDYVQVLRKRQKFQQALQQAKQLLDSAPQNPQFQSLFAVESMQCGDFEAAIDGFDKVLARLPGDPVTLTSRGHAYKTRGEYDAAVGSYHAALASQPQYGEAYYSLANLKVYSFSDDEISSMLAQESNNNLSHVDRVFLCFALGTACEDRDDFDTAFTYYERGNRLKKSQSRYDPEQMSTDLQAQRDICSSDFFRAPFRRRARGTRSCFHCWFAARRFDVT